MHYLTFIFIILLTACNSSSSESNKSATSFAINAEHINSAVITQLVAIKSLNVNCCDTSNLRYFVGIPSLGDVNFDNNSDILALYDEKMTLYGNHQWLTVSNYDENLSIYIDRYTNRGLSLKCYQ